KESTESKPKRSAICAAKIAPPAGPDSTKRTGNSAAVSTEIIPPPECIIKTSHTAPCFFNSSTKRARYDLMSGLTYAFAHTVLKRSYSRICGDTSEEMDTLIVGK